MQTFLVFPTRHYAEKNVLRTLLYTIHSLNEELFVSLCKKSSCFSFKTKQCQRSYVSTSVLHRLAIGIEAVFTCHWSLIDATHLYDLLCGICGFMLLLETALGAALACSPGGEPCRTCVLVHVSPHLHKQYFKMGLWNQVRWESWV